MSTASFFPKRGDTGGAAKARVVCRACPVRRECLSHAIESREWWGIWGGTNEKDRRPLNTLAARGVPVDVVVDMALAGLLDDEMAQQRSSAHKPVAERKRAS